MLLVLHLETDHVEERLEPLRQPGQEAGSPAPATRAA